MEKNQPKISQKSDQNQTKIRTGTQALDLPRPLIALFSLAIKRPAALRAAG